MKVKIVLLFTCSLMIFSMELCFSQYDSILHNSLYRTYLLHLPPSYIQGNPMPLVIAMHGGFGSGPQLEIQSRLSVKSDNSGFIVVYPEGVKSPLGIRTWNAGGCCGFAMNNNIDDVGFLSLLIDSLVTRYSIDISRIYATGMSNGAFMSYRLACERGDLIAAIAPVAGSMNVSTCNPARSLPIMHFHSYLDSSVPPDGGIGTGVSSHYNPPLDSVLNVWAGHSSCIVLNDTLHNSQDYIHINWSNCSCGNEMNLYLTRDGGHSWPGGVTMPSGDAASTVIEANDLMWTFFQQHILVCSTTGTLDYLPKRKKLIIYPNPFSSSVVIQLNSIVNNCELGIYNMLGQKVRSIQDISGDRIIIKRENLPNGNYFVRLTKDNIIIEMDKFIIAD